MKTCNILLCILCLISLLAAPEHAQLEEQDKSFQYRAKQKG